MLVRLEADVRLFWASFRTLSLEDVRTYVELMLHLVTSSVLRLGRLSILERIFCFWLLWERSIRLRLGVLNLGMF